MPEDVIIIQVGHLMMSAELTNITWEPIIGKQAVKASLASHLDFEPKVPRKVKRKKSKPERKSATVPTEYDYGDSRNDIKKLWKYFQGNAILHKKGNRPLSNIEITADTNMNSQWIAHRGAEWVKKKYARRVSRGVYVAVRKTAPKA